VLQLRAKLKAGGGGLIVDRDFRAGDALLTWAAAVLDEDRANAEAGLASHPAVRPASPQPARSSRQTMFAEVPHLRGGPGVTHLRVSATMSIKNAQKLFGTRGDLYATGQPNQDAALPVNTPKLGFGPQWQVEEPPLQEPGRQQPLRRSDAEPLCSAPPARPRGLKPEAS
jgi:hypothetical protein